MALWSYALTSILLLCSAAIKQPVRLISNSYQRDLPLTLLCQIRRDRRSTARIIVSIYSRLKIENCWFYPPLLWRLRSGDTLEFRMSNVDCSPTTSVLVCFLWLRSSPVSIITVSNHTTTNRWSCLVKWEWTCCRLLGYGYPNKHYQSVLLGLVSVRVSLGV